MPNASASRLMPLLIGALCVSGFAACNKNGRRGQSSLARWVEDPTAGSREGDEIVIPELQVRFEVPETLYVFRDCVEANHTPEGAHEWIPVVTCRSTSRPAFGGEDGEEDLFGDDEPSDTGAEPIEMTIYATHKTRPIDERAVAWFENQYRQAGLDVDEISYQHDFQKKAGIYARLHAVDSDTRAPSREIVQFMFPREDVVFIARMEYPFGETRSVDADWRYILWNFEFMAPPQSGKKK